MRGLFAFLRPSCGVSLRLFLGVRVVSCFVVACGFFAQSVRMLIVPGVLQSSQPLP